MYALIVNNNHSFSTYQILIYMYVEYLIIGS